MSAVVRFPASGFRQIELVENAKRMLAEARSLDEVKDIRDKAEAMRFYLKQRGDSLEAQNTAAEIKLRAERRAGELLKEMPKHEGGRPSVNQSHDGIGLPKLSDIGLTKNDSSRWQQIASLDEEVFEQHLADTQAKGKELTTSGVLKIVAQQTTAEAVWPDWNPEGGGDTTNNLQALIDAGRKFRTIYADPPWSYGNQATRASTDNHYGTMTVDEICAEPVAQLVEDLAHLHLWTTNGFLFDAKRVMEAWGFTYKSCFVWVKPQMGIGNYWRVSHEFLLFGIRGTSATAPFRAKDEPSWMEHPRTRHSEKPDAIRQKVEKVSPGPYLEMYGRVAHASSAWTVYGNQINRRLF